MPPHLASLITQLKDLRSEMLKLVEENGPILAQVQPNNLVSATNLLHYLALRRHDLRELQQDLADLGLSSLGRTETHVMSNLLAVLDILSCLQNGEPIRITKDGSAGDGSEGRRLLEENTRVLLGDKPDGRTTHVMVTMPPEAATDYGLVRDLVSSGMNCMRINCAHDSEEAWLGMIRNLRQAEQETGKTCRIHMDLAGPKLRTGPIKAAKAVLKYRPKRDEMGHILKPARIWLTPESKQESCPGIADVSIPVPGTWLKSLSPGDCVRFADARGSRRSITITGTAGKSRFAESSQTSYITSGIKLVAVYRDKSKPRRYARAGQIAASPQSILLKRGDTLILTRSLDPGEVAKYDSDEVLLIPARIGVTLPDVFNCVQPDQPVWLDDGKIGGIIRSVSPDEIKVEIVHARAAGEKLRAEKGINLPETKLVTPTLTAEDLKDLAFVAKHADLVGYSFVRTDEDVRLLQSHLSDLDAKHLGIVIKVETREGFENLPSLLLAVLGSQRAGVMIARGDLAIECGYERMAEVQEEILWLAEAAHVPVIWATQVLESLAKTGTPSRSEITDAAMGVRAECVMLNKGPYIVEAVRVLNDILARMEAHQEKKRSMLRKLSVAEGFEGGVPEAPHL